MRSSFYGIEVARQALLAQRKAMDVTAHNIANTSSEGYSRQVVSMRTSPPFAPPESNMPLDEGQLGSGVFVEEVKRVRDLFLDTRMRTELTTLGRWEIRRDTLAELEVIFNEPSDIGIRSVIEDFWVSLQDLANNPASMATRTTVLQRAVALNETLIHITRQMASLRQDLDAALTARVSEVNSLAEEISSLNAEIIRVQAAGYNANDLKDHRDLLLDALAKLVAIQVRETPVGGTLVQVGGAALVYDGNVNTIGTTQDASGWSVPVWERDGEQVLLTDGSVEGLMEVRDQLIPQYLSDVRAFTDSVRDAFNRVHQEGFGLDGVSGRLLFIDDPGSGELLKLNPEILADASKLAASASGEVGDASIALAMAQLRHEAIVNGASMDGFISAMLARLGVQSQEAQRMADNQSVLVESLEHQRQAVFGVSLDEEMTNLIMYQHAFNAAARVVTAMDEMLETMINRMGIVGR